MIEFICNKHRDKGVQSKDWSHFKSYTYGCSYCSGRGKTTDDIISLIKNKDVELISEYIGNEKPIDFANKGTEWANNEFEITKKRDSIKIEFCHTNNIPIIIIPYWEKDNMEYFIMNELNKLNGGNKI